MGRMFCAATNGLTDVAVLKYCLNETWPEH
jgi:hypothetical protein